MLTALKLLEDSECISAAGFTAPVPDADDTA